MVNPACGRAPPSAPPRFSEAGFSPASSPPKYPAAPPRVLEKRSVHHRGEAKNAGGSLVQIEDNAPDWKKSGTQSNQTRSSGLCSPRPATVRCRRRAAAAKIQLRQRLRPWQKRQCRSGPWLLQVHFESRPGKTPCPRGAAGAGMRKGPALLISRRAGPLRCVLAFSDAAFWLSPR